MVCLVGEGPSNVGALHADLGPVGVLVSRPGPRVYLTLTYFQRIIFQEDEDMLTYQHGDYAVHYDGDGQGEAWIVRTDPGSHAPTSEMKIPCEVLLGFVAELVRAEKIEQIESANSRSLLGLGGER